MPTDGGGGLARLRSRGTVLGIGVVGAGVTLSTMPLAWARLAGANAPNAGAVLTGREAAPAAFALALAALAGLGSLLLVGPAGRRVVGALVALLGIGIVAATVRVAMTLAERTLNGLSGTTLVVTDVATPTVTETPAWAWLAAAGGVLVFCAGILALVGGPGWPTPASRFDVASPVTPADPWRALDQGIDPTVDD